MMITLCCLYSPLPPPHLLQPILYLLPFPPRSAPRDFTFHFHGRFYGRARSVTDSVPTDVVSLCTVLKDVLYSLEVRVVQSRLSTCCTVQKYVLYGGPEGRVVQSRKTFCSILKDMVVYNPEGQVVLKDMVVYNLEDSLY